MTKQGKLIDLDVAIEEFNTGFGGVYHAVAAKQLLEQLPTVDPVHYAGGCYCRECALWMQTKSDLEYGFCCYVDELFVGTPEMREADDFCSLGIMKEGENAAD